MLASDLQCAFREEIPRRFDRKTLAQATTLVQQGVVEVVPCLGGGNRIKSLVKSLGKRPRHCDLTIERTISGVKIDGTCDCRQRRNCAHVAATAMSLLQENGAAAAVGATGPRITHETQAWLDRLRLARRRDQGAGGEDRDRLLYLLGHDRAVGAPRLTVRVVQARLRKGTGNRKGLGYDKESPFTAGSRSTAKVVTGEDRRILRALELESSDISRAIYRLGRIPSGELMEPLLASQRCHWQEAKGVRLSQGDPLAGEVLWRLDETGKQRPWIALKLPDYDLLPFAPPWYLDHVTGRCGPVRLDLPPSLASALLTAPPLSEAEVALVRETIAEVAPELQNHLPAAAVEERDDVAPVPCLRLASEMVIDPDRPWTSVEVKQHTAYLSFDYAGHRVNPDDEEATFLVHGDGGAPLRLHRQSEQEYAYLSTLYKFSFMARNSGHPREAEIPFTADPDLGLAPWVDFTLRQLPRLEAAGWRIEIDPGFELLAVEPEAWYATLDDTSGKEWFDLSLQFEVDGERHDLLPILVQLIRDQGANLELRELAALPDDAICNLHMEDGRLLCVEAARLRPVLETLVELYDPESVDEAGRLRLPRHAALHLDGLGAQALTWEGGEAVRELGERLRNFDRIERVPVPHGLDATLRDYQRDGLDWLQFLRTFDLGGVLADDMGLGKTVQALAHILVEKESGRGDRPSLVVAPTTLMVNWRREAERFAPDLTLLTLHGPKRKAHFDEIPEVDLVFTTYPLLARDRDALTAHDYHLLILDEAQAIKNPRAKAAEVVRTLTARHRLCLTGTPMENHLGELWSLFHFLMPGLLGDERRFKRLFRNPIERHDDTDRQAHLNRRVAPFLLRRTKEEVAQELPEKSKLVRRVVLEGRQRDLYETVRATMHAKVRREIDRKGVARAHIVILDALLKLRQVCCDPRLVKLPAARKVKQSAKLDLLTEMLPSLIEEGRRVLLFSQFTTMLGLIEAEVKRRKIGYVKLTGQTRDRATPVDRFQAGEVPLFLISLKAGGSGLNLTAADTVIHYDPWWNPAVERQATDRAHRIGQEKHVFVYKLLTEGTVEEKIAEMQARKQALADALFGGGRSHGPKLGAEDLKALFEPLD